MRVRPTYLALLLAAPAAVLFASRRLGPRTPMALGVTVFATLLCALLAGYWFYPDPSDISAAIRFYLFILPCLTAGVAGTLAAALTGRRARILPAAVAALLGCFVGVVIVYVTPSAASMFWARILTIAPPVTYASCAAVVAASMAGRSR